MPKRNDEALVAYLDGELDSTERAHVEAWLEADPMVRERLAALQQSTDLARRAFAEMLDEPLPERLLAAARGKTASAEMPAQEAEILVLRPPPKGRAGAERRWLSAIAAAAGLFGLLLGGAGTYIGISVLSPAKLSGGQQAAVDANTIWLDNAAGYYKLTVNAGDNMLIDVPASNDNNAAWQRISQNLPQQMRPPHLEPWGLTFRGARLVVVEGRPAAELVYATDKIGPLTLVIGTSKLPEIAPTFDHRQDVNLVYWRHHGRAYALVGRSDNGYLWGIALDVASQFDAI